MKGCDELLEQVRQYIVSMASEGILTRIIQCLPKQEEFPEEPLVRFPGRGGESVVLEENTAVELGNPSCGSSSFLLWSRNTGLVNDGQVTLIGPDIPEAIGQSLPFGQILLLGGAGLEKEHILELARVQYLSHHLEGYMVRSTPRYLWSRVSKQAIEKGFSFETLGRAIIFACKKRISINLHVEIVFVTSSKEDIARLEMFGAKSRELIANLKRSMFANLNNDECTGENCGSCPERPTCDNLREILNLRERRRVRNRPA